MNIGYETDRVCTYPQIASEIDFIFLHYKR